VVHHFWAVPFFFLTTHSLDLEIDLRLSQSCDPKNHLRQFSVQVEACMIVSDQNPLFGLIERVYHLELPRLAEDLNTSSVDRTVFTRPEYTTTLHVDASLA
jgi:hypothetical protein